MLLFVGGIGLTAYPLWETIHKHQKPWVNTTIGGEHPLLQRTIEYQFSMHGEMFHNRTAALLDFLPQVMGFFDISRSVDSYMFLNTDEACAMLYVR